MAQQSKTTSQTVTLTSTDGDVKLANVIPASVEFVAAHGTMNTADGVVWSVRRDGGTRDVFVRCYRKMADNSVQPVAQGTQVTVALTIVYV